MASNITCIEQTLSRAGPLGTIVADSPGVPGRPALPRARLGLTYFYSYPSLHTAWTRKLVISPKLPLSDAAGQHIVCAKCQGRHTIASSLATMSCESGLDISAILLEPYQPRESLRVAASHLAHHLPEKSLNDLPVRQKCGQGILTQ
jgi:hypothetical protein